MLYRLFKPEDFDALYAIEEICFQPPFRFGRRYMRRLIDAPNSATWIAEDGRMAGFAIAEWTQEWASVSAYLQTIEVGPEHRSRGVGSELLCRAESSMHAAGASTFWLHVDASNARAIRFYETRGYALCGTEDDYYAPGRGALIYRKALEAKTAI
jgi:ribosomal-protein-alanine N-acetyltransferase